MFSIVLFVFIVFFLNRCAALKIAFHKCLMEACRVIAALNRNLLRVEFFYIGIRSGIKVLSR
ncbi:hypothetical protein AtNW77_Chr5g0089371 [Arabidopsis thaliana]